MSAAEGHGESSSITVAEAARVIKDHAAKQPIRLELSEEQLEATGEPAPTVPADDPGRDPADDPRAHTDG